MAWWRIWRGNMFNQVLLIAIRRERPEAWEEKRVDRADAGVERVKDGGRLVEGGAAVRRRMKQRLASRSHAGSCGRIRAG